jgi:UDP:flavonoid glycosyltransferase YjiC (YdhE family)
MNREMKKHAALAHAITQAVTDSAMRARAADLGTKIRAEDGVGKAVELVGRYVDEMRARHALPLRP